MKDMIKYLFEHRPDYIDIPTREINDISQRRARLSEWICYKLAQQHKINKKKKEQLLSLKKDYSKIFKFFKNIFYLGGSFTLLVLAFLIVT